MWPVGWPFCLRSLPCSANQSNIVPPSVAKFDHRKHLCRVDDMGGEHGLLTYFVWYKNEQLGRRNVFIPLLCLPNSILCSVVPYKILIYFAPCDNLLPAFS